MAPALRDGFVLGIDFGGSKTALATADARGRILRRERLVVRRQHGAERTLSEALAEARRLMADAAEQSGGPCRAVGVATPGIPTDNGVLLSPNLPGWEELPLARRVRHGLAVEQVSVRNDVKCAALAELRWGALRDVDPGLYLNLGTGVSAALTVAGQVVEGAHHGAGEIGYGGFWSPGEPVKWTLEELVGGRSLGERASDLLGRRLTTKQLFEQDEAEVRELVDQALEGLAAYLGNLVLALDPARIAIGGGLMGDSARILATLRSNLTTPGPLRPEIVAARFRQDASLKGAVAFALDSLRTDPAAARGAGEQQHHADGRASTGEERADG